MIGGVIGMGSTCLGISFPRASIRSFKPRLSGIDCGSLLKLISGSSE